MGLHWKKEIGGRYLTNRFNIMRDIFGQKFDARNLGSRIWSVKSRHTSDITCFNTKARYLALHFTQKPDILLRKRDILIYTKSIYLSLYKSKVSHFIPMWDISLSKRDISLLRKVLSEISRFCLKARYLVLMRDISFLVRDISLAARYILILMWDISILTRDISLFGARYLAFA